MRFSLLILAMVLFGNCSAQTAAPEAEVVAEQTAEEENVADVEELMRDQQGLIAEEIALLQALHIGEDTPITEEELPEELLEEATVMDGMTTTNGDIVIEYDDSGDDADEDEEIVVEDMDVRAGHTADGGDDSSWHAPATMAVEGHEEEPMAPVPAHHESHHQHKKSEKQKAKAAKAAAHHQEMAATKEEHSTAADAHAADANATMATATQGHTAAADAHAHHHNGQATKEHHTKTAKAHHTMVTTAGTVDRPMSMHHNDTSMAPRVEDGGSSGGAKAAKALKAHKEPSAKAHKAAKAHHAKISKAMYVLEHRHDSLSMHHHHVSAKAYKQHASMAPVASKPAEEEHHEPEVYGDCVYQIMEGSGTVGAALPDVGSCCASNAAAPYCRYLTCSEDKSSCDCTVLSNAYEAAKPYGTGIVGIPEGFGHVLEGCCLPNAGTTFEDAWGCIATAAEGMTGPPTATPVDDGASDGGTTDGGANDGGATDGGTPNDGGADAGSGGGDGDAPDGDGASDGGDASDGGGASDGAMEAPSSDQEQPGDDTASAGPDDEGMTPNSASSSVKATAEFLNGDIVANHHTGHAHGVVRSPDVKPLTKHHAEENQADKFTQEIMEVLLESHGGGSHLAKSQEGVSATNLVGEDDDDDDEEWREQMKFAEAKSGGAGVVVGTFCLLASWILVHAVAA